MEGLSLKTTRTVSVHHDAWTEANEAKSSSSAWPHESAPADFGQRQPRDPILSESTFQAPVDMVCLVSCCNE